MCNCVLIIFLGYWKKRSLNALYYVEEFVYLSIFSFCRYSPVVLTSLFEKPVITFTHTRTETHAKNAAHIHTHTHTHHVHRTSRETESWQLDSSIKYIYVRTAPIGSCKISLLLYALVSLYYRLFIYNFFFLKIYYD